MGEYLVDSNVLLDVIMGDPVWGEWSGETLQRLSDRNLIVINPVIYAEISVRFERIEDLDAAFPADVIGRRPIPWEAAFLAGKCFLKYRQRGGTRTSPLPDFFIGAHAAVEKLPLLTRDPARYRTYFPSVELICPELK
jgi:predicted nucleic acid-binding protein